MGSAALTHPTTLLDLRCDGENNVSAG